MKQWARRDWTVAFLNQDSGRGHEPSLGRAGLQSHFCGVICVLRWRKRYQLGWSMIAPDERITVLRG